MANSKVVEALVSGGQATAGPPLGPALGPLGINTMAVVGKINELTKDYAGMKVPVKIAVNVGRPAMLPAIQVEKEQKAQLQAQAHNVMNRVYELLSEIENIYNARKK